MVTSPGEGERTEDKTSGQGEALRPGGLSWRGVAGGAERLCPELLGCVAPSPWAAVATSSLGSPWVACLAGFSDRPSFGSWVTCPVPSPQACSQYSWLHGANLNWPLSLCYLGSPTSICAPASQRAL